MKQLITYAIIAFHSFHPVPAAPVLVAAETTATVTNESVTVETCNAVIYTLVVNRYGRIATGCHTDTGTGCKTLVFSVKDGSKVVNYITNL